MGAPNLFRKRAEGLEVWQIPQFASGSGVLSAKPYGLEPAFSPGNPWDLRYFMFPTAGLCQRFDKREKWSNSAR
jgi:hypothetical protein